MVKYRLNIKSIMPTTEKDRQTFRDRVTESDAEKEGERLGKYHSPRPRPYSLTRPDQSQ